VLAFGKNLSGLRLKLLSNCSRALIEQAMHNRFAHVEQLDDVVACVAIVVIALEW
jgi:hypothetical protein